jgi:hypothetical protein
MAKITFFNLAGPLRVVGALSPQRLQDLEINLGGSLGWGSQSWMARAF